MEAKSNSETSVSIYKLGCINSEHEGSSFVHNVTIYRLDRRDLKKE